MFSAKAMEWIGAAVLIFVVQIQFAKSASLPGFDECVLNNHRYSIGEVFHPVIDVNGTELEAVCLNCTCLPSAISQCEQVICPPVNCAQPVRFVGRCCDICIEPPTIVASVKCRYHSLQLSEGEKFRPVDRIENFNTTGTGRSECIECLCEGGEVTCRDFSNECPSLACNESEAYYEDGECCKQCPVIPQVQPQGPGCYDFDGRYILEGETWHPVLPGFGLVDCVNCTCQNSLPRCVKAECPQVPPCGPDEPIDDFILCCPRCNSTVIPPTTNTTENLTTIAPITPELTPCESPYIYKVYKHYYNDTLALENLETEIVEIYNWTMMVGPDGSVVEKGYYEISRIMFLQENNGEFEFRGYTIDRRVRGLKNKESKRERIENCRENCAQMVSNMLRPVTTLSDALACGD